MSNTDDKLTQVLDTPIFDMETDPLKRTEDNKSNTVGRRIAGLLQHTADELRKLSEYMPELALSDDERTVDYINTIRSAQPLHYDDGLYGDLSERKDATFKQSVEYGGRKLGIGRASNIKSSDNVLSGEKAIIRATEALGLGTMVRVPLWRSGIWLTIKAPSDDKLSEMERRISQNKVNLGRDTYGNVFSNAMVYTVREVVELILSQVYQANVKIRNNRKLLSLIKLTDLHMLVQGFMCSIYPKGYPYSQACTSDVTECNHIEHADVNLTKLIWTDRSRLTDTQLAFMTNPDKIHTVTEVEEYQTSHIFESRNSLEIGELKVFFREPSIEDFIDTGNEWIESIVKSSERVFDEKASQTVRNNYIYEQATVRSLGRWAHWVGEIQIGVEDDLDDSDVSYIRDRTSINRIISTTISGMGDVRKTFVDAVLDYITDSTITVVGIPRYTCPSCNGEPTVHDKYKEIIPINPVTVFFMLLDQKLSLIAETE